MKFSIGDKVVHPQHGPGRITGIASRELFDEPTRYYVIDIPRQGLTVHLPVHQAQDSGLRPAMSAARCRRVLSILRGKPHRLPANYKQRQEQLSARLKTGRVIELVGVVRDLTWYRQRAHLTKRDADYLRQGHDLLSAEIALASGQTVSDASKQIEESLAQAMAGVAG